MGTKYKTCHFKFTTKEKLLVLVSNLGPSIEVFHSRPHGLVVPPLRRRVGLLGGEGRLGEIVISRARRIAMASDMCLGLNLLLALVTKGKVIATWVSLESAPNSRCGMARTTVWGT